MLEYGNFTKTQQVLVVLLEDLYVVRLFKMGRDKLNIGKHDKAWGRVSGAAARTGSY